MFNASKILANKYKDLKTAKKKEKKKSYDFVSFSLSLSRTLDKLIKFLSSEARRMLAGGRWSYNIFFLLQPNIVMCDISPSQGVGGEGNGWTRVKRFARSLT